MPIIMHYGVPLDTDKPTTGVLQNNRLEGFGELISGDHIDLAWEDHLEECSGMCSGCDCKHADAQCDCGLPEEHDFREREDHDRCGPQESGDLLVGSWEKDEEGLYQPDRSGEFAAIVRETVTQVVWSKHTERGALCSPCYPGQVDLDTPGKILAYTLPKEYLGDR